jgi:hypothetical protein
MMTLEFLWEKKGLLAALVKMQPLKVCHTNPNYELAQPGSAEPPFWQATAFPDRFSPALRECVASVLHFNPGSRPDARALLAKIRASKRGGGDDNSALISALEGFGISDALSEVADSVKKGFESFSGGLATLWGGTVSDPSTNGAVPALVKPGRLVGQHSHALRCATGVHLCVTRPSRPGLPGATFSLPCFCQALRRTSRSGLRNAYWA